MRVTVIFLVLFFFSCKPTKENKTECEYVALSIAGPGFWKKSPTLITEENVRGLNKSIVLDDSLFIKEFSIHLEKMTVSWISGVSNNVRGVGDLKCKSGKVQKFIVTAEHIVIGGDIYKRDEDLLLLIDGAVSKYCTDRGIRR